MLRDGYPLALLNRSTMCLTASPSWDWGLDEWGFIDRSRNLSSHKPIFMKHKHPHPQAFSTLASWFGSSISLQPTVIDLGTWTWLSAWSKPRLQSNICSNWSSASHHLRCPRPISLALIGIVNSGFKFKTGIPSFKWPIPPSHHTPPSVYAAQGANIGDPSTNQSTAPPRGCIQSPYRVDQKINIHIWNFFGRSSKRSHPNIYFIHQSPQSCHQLLFLNWLFVHCCGNHLTFVCRSSVETFVCNNYTSHNPCTPNSEESICLPISQHKNSFQALSEYFHRLT